MHSEIAFNSIFIASSVSHSADRTQELKPFVSSTLAQHFNDRGMEIRMAALNFLMWMVGAAQTDSVVLKP
jgi:hypothetical protein